MQLKLVGITYNDDEISRVVQLRTIEWDAFPAFATRSFAPIAMFWIPWWQLMLLLAALSLVWCPIRNHVASPTVSAVGALLNMALVAIPANIVIAVVFFYGACWRVASRSSGTSFLRYYHLHTRRAKNPSSRTEYFRKSMEDSSNEV